MGLRIRFEKEELIKALNHYLKIKPIVIDKGHLNGSIESILRFIPGITFDPGLRFEEIDFYFDGYFVKQSSDPTKYHVDIEIYGGGNEKKENQLKVEQKVAQEILKLIDQANK